MNKKIKVRSGFHFERDVIDVILNLIKDNQVYLTKEENLPQLAKLGYMYNTLWYAGRVCWGYDGLIQKGEYDEENDVDYSSCEDNPKYKIEMCKPKNEKIDNLIYDAWGMHVSNELTTPTFKKFCQIIIDGEEQDDFQLLMLKPNKTLDEWCKVLMDKRYAYQYESKRDVVGQLLFTIGTEYSYNSETGFIFHEASGADQDITVYDDWKNAKFRDDINKVVLELLKMPEVKNTVDVTHNYEYKIKKENKAKIDKEDAKFAKLCNMTLKELRSSRRSMMKTTIAERGYQQYYPVCEYSSITKFDSKTHPSYVKAGIEACKDIVAHSKEERKENVKFAQEFLQKFNTKTEV